MLIARNRILSKSMLLCLLTLLVFAKMGQAQEPALTAAAIEQSSQQPVPTLVRSQGTLAGHPAEKLLLRFSVYSTEASRELLWTE
jgi:hypothetical protein